MTTKTYTMDFVPAPGDGPLIDVRLIFGSIEIQDLPPRIEGNDVIPRHRIIHRDGFGGVKVGPPEETGMRLVDGAQYAYMFGPRRWPADPK